VTDVVIIFFGTEITLEKEEFPVDTSHSFPLTWAHSLPLTRAFRMTSKSRECARGWR
jgi:hypothetical protein